MSRDISGEPASRSFNARRYAVIYNLCTCKDIAYHLTDVLSRCCTRSANSCSLTDLTQEYAGARIRVYADMAARAQLLSSLGQEQF